MFCWNFPRCLVIITYVTSLSFQFLTSIWKNCFSEVRFRRPSMSHRTCCYHHSCHHAVTSSDSRSGHVFFESCPHLKYRILVRKACNEQWTAYLRVKLLIPDNSKASQGKRLAHLQTGLVCFRCSCRRSKRRSVVPAIWLCWNGWQTSYIRKLPLKWRKTYRIRDG